MAAKVEFQRNPLDWQRALPVGWDARTASGWYALGERGRWEIIGSGKRFRVYLTDWSFTPRRQIGSSHSGLAEAQREAEERDAEKD